MWWRHGFFDFFDTRNSIDSMCKGRRNIFNVHTHYLFYLHFCAGIYLSNGLMPCLTAASTKTTISVFIRLCGPCINALSLAVLFSSKDKSGRIVITPVPLPVLPRSWWLTSNVRKPWHTVLEFLIGFTPFRSVLNQAGVSNCQKEKYNK